MKISPPKVPSFVSGLGLALLLVVFLGPLLPACSSLPKGEVQRAVLSGWTGPSASTVVGWRNLSAQNARSQ